MQTILLILGLLVTILTFWDFFHTTVSGNGFGPISLRINKFLAKTILRTRSKTLFHYSGFIHIHGDYFHLVPFPAFGRAFGFYGKG